MLRCFTYINIYIEQTLFVSEDDSDKITEQIKKMKGIIFKTGCKIRYDLVYRFSYLIHPVWASL